MTALGNRRAQPTLLRKSVIWAVLAPFRCFYYLPEVFKVLKTLVFYTLFLKMTGICHFSHFPEFPLFNEIFVIFANTWIKLVYDLIHRFLRLLNKLDIFIWTHMAFICPFFNFLFISLIDAMQITGLSGPLRIKQ